MVSSTLSPHPTRNAQNQNKPFPLSPHLQSHPSPYQSYKRRFLGRATKNYQKPPHLYQPKHHTSFPLRQYTLAQPSTSIIYYSSPCLRLQTKHTHKPTTHRHPQTTKKHSPYSTSAETDASLSSRSVISCAHVVRILHLPRFGI